MHQPESILTLTSESTVEPVTLGELKTYLRMESTDSTNEDALLSNYITVARKQAENKTKRSYVIASRSVILDDFPFGSTAEIELPHAPLSTVSSNVLITYVQNNTAGTTTTVGATSITVDFDKEPGRIYPSFNNVWPTDVREQRKAVTVSYVTGYTTVAGVPEPVKTWIKMRAADMFENRESITDASINELPRTYVDGLLDEFTLITITS